MKRSTLTIISLFMFILFPTILLAATHCIRSGASGSSCADWGSNACNALPSTLVRGDTYYIAKGSYAGRTFNTAVSGTALITIKGATVADHGTDTGWSSSYSVDINDGGGQATFGNIFFNSNYWVFDGSVGNMTKTATSYGFSFGTSGGNGVIQIGADGTGTCGTAVSNITVAHFYCKATTADTQKEFVQGGSYGGVLSNVTLQYFLVDGFQGLFMTKSGACSSTPYSNWIVEYGIMLNGYSSSANHGEWINPNERDLSGFIFRYNWIDGSSGSAGMTAWIVANNANLSNADIYGNLFTNAYVGNGVISDNHGSLINVKVYNNTFANGYVATCTPLQAGFTSGNSATAYNNLFYNMSGSGCTAAHINFNTHDYNEVLGSSNDSETHIVTGSANPFVAAGYGDWRDYKLKAATPAGMTLSSPYNIDVDGNVRGSDGTWDRGAFEFGGTGSALKKPMPPMLH